MKTREHFSRYRPLGQGLTAIIITFTLTGLLFISGGEGSGRRSYRTRHAFGNSTAQGYTPTWILADVATGGLYGTCYSGGDGGDGTLFKLTPSSGEVTVLHSFPSGPEDGKGPLGGITVGSDGVLYGTAPCGGACSAGVVFSIKPDGSGYRILHTFRGGDKDGRTPLGDLVADTQGRLFGATYAGGPTGDGTIFCCNQNGSDFRTLVSLDRREGEGANPSGGLVGGPEGRLYGTTLFGGVAGAGTIYAVLPGRGAIAILHAFDPEADDGGNPRGKLLLSPEGVLFGVTSSGGRYGMGTVFRLNADGSDYVILHHFRGWEGGFPQCGLAFGPDRSLYGTSLGGGVLYGTLFRLKQSGKGYAVLHQFGNSPDDGRPPCSRLSLGPDGRFYGALQNGGSAGMGTIFSLSPSSGSFGRRFKSMVRSALP